jgi:phosphatidylglycerophosphatase A
MLFGLKNFPVMPGTLRSFFRRLFYIIIIQKLPISSMIFTIVVLILFVMVMCNMAEKEIWGKDPSSVILDEFVAMPICFLGVKHFVQAGIAIWTI